MDADHRRHDHLQGHRIKGVSGAGGLSRGADTQKENVALRHGAEVRASSTGIFASILHMAIGMTVIAAVLAAITTVFIH